MIIECKICHEMFECPECDDSEDQPDICQDCPADPDLLG